MIFDSWDDHVAFTFFLIILPLFIIVLFISVPYLSWCYNTSIGTSTGLKLVYLLMVFIFPYVYLPYYAFFLNPICSQRKNNSIIQIGGFKI